MRLSGDSLRFRRVIRRFVARPPLIGRRRAPGPARLAGPPPRTSRTSPRRARPGRPRARPVPRSAAGVSRPSVNAALIASAYCRDIAPLGDRAQPATSCRHRASSRVPPVARAEVRGQLLAVPLPHQLHPNGKGLLAELNPLPVGGRPAGGARHLDPVPGQPFDRRRGRLAVGADPDVEDRLADPVGELPGQLPRVERPGQGVPRRVDVQPAAGGPQLGFPPPGAGR